MTIPLLQFSMVENLGLMRVFVGVIYIWSLILLKFELQEGRKGQNYEIYKHLTHKAASLMRNEMKFTTKAKV